jgi:predicted AAA+ superfamily ATPase
MLALKRAVDEDRRPGRFLITGSANILTMKTARESLAGRMEVVTLLPLAQAERLDLEEPTFLPDVFAGRLSAPAKTIVGPDLVRAVLAGGFPSALERGTPRRQRDWARAYIAAITERDVQDISSIDKPGEIPRLIAVAAHHSAQLLNITTISNALGLARRTADGYTLVTGEPGNLFHRSPPPRSCVREGDPEGVEGAFRARNSLNNPL